MISPSAVLHHLLLKSAAETGAPVPPRYSYKLAAITDLGADQAAVRQSLANPYLDPHVRTIRALKSSWDPNMSSFRSPSRADGREMQNVARAWETYHLVDQPQRDAMLSGMKGRDQLKANLRVAEPFVYRLGGATVLGGLGQLTQNAYNNFQRPEIKAELAAKTTLPSDKGDRALVGLSNKEVQSQTGLALKQLAGK